MEPVPSTPQGLDLEKVYRDEFIKLAEFLGSPDAMILPESELNTRLIHLAQGVPDLIRQIESRAREEGEAKAAEQYRGLGALTRSEAVRLRLSAAQVERERCVKIVETMTAPKNYPTAFQGGYDLALHDAIQSINK